MMLDGYLSKVEREDYSRSYGLYGFILITLLDREKIGLIGGVGEIAPIAHEFRMSNSMRDMLFL
jgi:hypothetical protein